MNLKMSCPICNSKVVEMVYRNPAASFSHSHKRFALEISLCRRCGFVFQSSALRREYDKLISQVYQMYRKKNDNFAFPRRCPDYRDTFQMICDNFPDKPDACVLEIGSNRGDMLYLVKERFPRANILGVEPTSFENLAVPTLTAFFSKELFSNKFDVIILQHVLEHIKYPQKFLGEIVSVLDDEGILYIEVPNVENTLFYRTEDFIADHVNYFSPSTLERIMGGFKVVAQSRKPFLRVVAKKSKGARPRRYAKPDIAKIKDSFAQYRQKKEKLIKRLIAYSRAGKKIVFYGVSTYFRILFHEIRGLLNRKNCFYYDDNFKANFEDTFRLPRVACFDKDCVVVICSNVYRVQEAVAEKLKSKKALAVVRPWLKELKS